MLGSRSAAESRERLGVRPHHHVPVEQQPLHPIDLARRAAGDGRGDAHLAPALESLDQRSQRALLAVVREDRLAQVRRRPEREGHRRARRPRATARRPRAPGSARARASSVSSEAKCCSGGSARSLRAVGLGPDLVDLGPQLLGGAVDAERIVHVDQRLARPVRQVVEHRGRARPGRSPGAAPPSRRPGCPRGSCRASRGGGWSGCRCARRRRARRPRRRSCVSSVKSTSRAGMSVASFRSSAVRCVAGSNSRSDSTVSPNSSMRSGRL